MGQSESTEKALDNTGRSAITFSDDVLRKISEETEPEPEQFVPERVFKEIVPGEMTDEDWFEKLKEMDDNHSNISGFSADSFNHLMEKIEYRVNDIEFKVPYAHDMLMETLQSNKNVSLYTSPVVQNYIECADIFQRKMLNRRLFEKKLEENQRRRNKRRFIF